MEQKIGHYSFIGGVIIAVVLGLFSTQVGPSAGAWLASLLVVLGLIAGFLNVSGKETKEFLEGKPNLPRKNEFIQAIHSVGIVMDG